MRMFKQQVQWIKTSFVWRLNAKPQRGEWILQKCDEGEKRIKGFSSAFVKDTFTKHEKRGKSTEGNYAFNKNAGLL